MYNLQKSYLLPKMRKTKVIILLSLIILYTNSYINAHKFAQSEKLLVGYKNSCPKLNKVKQVLNKIAYIEISQTSKPDITIDAKKYCYIDNYTELEKNLYQDINHLLEEKYG
jgi:hypothetical protein